MFRLLPAATLILAAVAAGPACAYEPYPYRWAGPPARGWGGPPRDRGWDGPRHTRYEARRYEGHRDHRRDDRRW